LTVTVGGKEMDIMRSAYFILKLVIQAALQYSIMFSGLGVHWTKKMFKYFFLNP